MVIHKECSPLSKIFQHGGVVDKVVDNLDHSGVKNPEYGNPDRELSLRLKHALISRHRKLLELKTINTEIGVVKGLLNKQRPKSVPETNFERIIQAQSSTVRRRYLYDSLDYVFDSCRLKKNIDGVPVDQLRAKTASPRQTSFDGEVQISNNQLSANTGSRWVSSVRRNRRVTIFKPVVPGEDENELPPQFPSTALLDRLDTFLRASTCSHTKEMLIISPFVPEARPGHVLPLIPGRSAEDPNSKDKHIEFKNKLFRRSGRVRWNRFIEDLPPHVT